MPPETTQRMQRDQLLGLLNTMSSHEEQRVTREIAVMPPDDREEDLISDLKITFWEPVFSPPGSRIAVAVSFALTLFVGLSIVLSVV